MTRILLTPEESRFQSPVLGIVGGSGIIIVGIIFAPQISRFVSSMEVQFYPERFGNLIVRVQLARVRAFGILICLFGAAVLAIGTVSALQGL